jgi:DNA gyrase inhibitor GyrI
VAKKDGDFEIRRYEPTLVAEVTVTGSRDGAVNAGFRILAAFIFGDNAPAEKIAMTVPVTQQPGERIAMTAPVTQSGKDGTWTVRFGMPARYTAQTLPAPKDERIRIVELPARTVASVRFSGFRTDAALAEQAARLAAFVTREGLQPLGPPVFAYYDPPWSIPFLRRNEVLVDVK